MRHIPSALRATPTIPNMHRIESSSSQWLFSIAATRQIEQRAAATLPAHTLMQRAGLATARLTMALAPHARNIWVACGPGNNGGDGFEAALQLHLRGRGVIVTCTGTAAGKSLPPDAQAAFERAQAAGVPIEDDAPDDFDFCIDALLGVGASANEDRTRRGLLVPWLAQLYAGSAPCLAVDVPSGLDADTGTRGAVALSAIKSGATQAHNRWASKRFTLSLLTLKPGLFTAAGRAAAGEIWFDDLGMSSDSRAAAAWLVGADRAAQYPRGQAPHDSHKGSFGDVVVIGGESAANGRTHMIGAALLAARGALHGGAGRVFVVLLGDAGGLPTLDASQPELMFRGIESVDWARQVVVCGCGGGDSVNKVLPQVLTSAARLVLDADALNAISSDTSLQTMLSARGPRGWQTVITPHPLEAARLLGRSVADIQADRLGAANRLSLRFSATVVLKGSGTVIASAGRLSAINSSGNALLATAGTGDVLAGLLGAHLAADVDRFDAACRAVFRHGAIADRWAQDRPAQGMTASDLATAA
jgi:ADP-dependent NAD(P)H-hydrate dehydratase / NAD(P)H-hydrate epimerase